jgi:hypothetical protein
LNGKRRHFDNVVESVGYYNLADQIDHGTINIRDAEGMGRLLVHDLAV